MAYENILTETRDRVANQVRLVANDENHLVQRRRQHATEGVPD